jgi:RimJ/RimL family protein N-acetyltransferase
MGVEPMAFQLETERLSMRWLTLVDADLMLSVWNDPAFVRHVGDRGIRTVEQAHDTLSQGAFELYRNYGYGPYRVALTSSDTEIGTCGLFRRVGFDDPDIGYSILPEYCGQGYAFEAANAILEYARSELRLKRLTAFISPGNAASIGLAEKLGLQFESSTRLVGEDEDVSLYSMTMQD